MTQSHEARQFSGPAAVTAKPKNAGIRGFKILLGTGTYRRDKALTRGAPEEKEVCVNFVGWHEVGKKLTPP